MATIVNTGKLDFNTGVLGAAVDATKAEVVKASAPDLARADSTESNASIASASAMFSAASSASAATSISTSSIKESSLSSSNISSSQFGISSGHLLIEDTCTKLELKGTYLHVDCKRLDGSTIHSQINLDEVIGFIDGRLEWGLKGFSKHCEYSLDGFFLVIKYRLHEGEDYRTTRLDLRLRLRNADGVLIVEKLDQKLSAVDGALKVIPQSNAVDAKIDVAKVSAPDLLRNVSTQSTASDASTASTSSAFSATSSTSAATSISTSSVAKSSSSHFSSTQFRTSSKHLLLEDTCVKLELKGTYLHAYCHRLDGSITHSQINLDGIIGFIDGRLEWDLKDFSKHCFECSLDGFFLVVKYRHREGEDHHVARLDLRVRLRNADGVIIIIELNKKLSVMLSEVPWMKFKVIAEPDLSVFAKHPVMQETLTRIAETTVEHVTVEMHKKLTLAMEAAIIAVTASAMSHVSSQMETLVQDAVGYASASASITAAESLRLYGGGRWGTRLHGRGDMNVHAIEGGYDVYGNGDGYVYGNGGGYGYAGQGFNSGRDEHHVLKNGQSVTEIAKEVLGAHV